MLTHYQINKYAISRQKATVITITVLTYYLVPDLSEVENLEFIFRYCVAFRLRKEKRHIGPLLKARAGQVGLLARISEFGERVLPVCLKTKCSNERLICPVCSKRLSLRFAVARNFGPDKDAIPIFCPS